MRTDYLRVFFSKAEELLAQLSASEDGRLRARGEALSRELDSVRKKYVADIEKLCGHPYAEHRTNTEPIAETKESGDGSLEETVSKHSKDVLEIMLLAKAATSVRGFEMPAPKIGE